MARLNEPNMNPSNDSIESLRRRFLRQNREITRVNSNQLQRIRQLENECARLLSEKLDLRGQVMRLEQVSSAHRVADHALQVKSQLEAQLAELGALVARIGQPPAKQRRTSKEVMECATSRRRSAPRAGSSPPRRQCHGDPSREAEALAEQQGRLPPIHENKLYPRATMNSEEILALCSEATDTTESPGLGSPPVSRFGQENQVEPESPPTESPAHLESGSQPEKPPEPTETQASTSPQKLGLSRPSSAARLETKEPEFISAEPSSPSPPALTAPLFPSSTSKKGAKRKFNDENAISADMAGKGEKGKGTREALGQPQPQSTSDLAGNGRGLIAESVKEKQTTGLGVVSTNVAVRKPLGAKSSNEQISSPMKKAKAPLGGTAKANTLSESRHAASKGRSVKVVRKKDAASVSGPRLEASEQPPLSPTSETIAKEPAVGNTSSEQRHSSAAENQPEALPPKTPFLVPDTPDRVPWSTMSVASIQQKSDTPPPGHISAHGETSRPSRRARATISYAEPNLRDKMRRPTKELFDAVTGEAKFKSRSVSDPTTSTPESELLIASDSNWKNVPVAEAAAAHEARPRGPVVSSLAQNELVVMSPVKTGEGASSFGTRLLEKPSHLAQDSNTVKGLRTGRPADVYDMIVSPVTKPSESRPRPREENVINIGSKRSQLKEQFVSSNRPSSMRSANNHRVASAEPATSADAASACLSTVEVRGGRSGSRKCASLAGGSSLSGRVVTSTSAPDVGCELPDDFSDEGANRVRTGSGGVSAGVWMRDRASRRRSMML